MARYFGLVGFTSQVEVEDEPGVWEDKIVERLYYGELIQNFRNLQSTDGVHDSVTIGNNISIIADPYANENFHSIRYAEYMGTKWKVNKVEVQYPRLILSLGGVWNGEQERTTE